MMIIGNYHRQVVVWIVALFLGVTISGCSSTPPVRKSPAYEATGIASYYGRKFHGRRTASGERFDMHAMTAAHPSLAFGTRVHVTNLKTGRSMIVRINDRGPFVGGRIIDLSYAAARKIGMLADGVSRVRITVISP